MADAKAFFEDNLAGKLSANPDKVKEIGAIFLFKIEGDGGGEWTVNLKDEVGVKPGGTDGADCTLECTSEVWDDIASNPSAAMTHFFSGALKVSGNPMLATKLQELLG